MAKADKSFEDFLNDAPLAPDTSTLTVVGALARMPEPGKFVLTLSNGHSATLDAKAVKSFTRLGSAVGQMLVQLELDAKLVPKDFGQAAPTAEAHLTVLASDVTPPTIGYIDHKLPIFDHTVLAKDYLKPPIVDTLVPKAISDSPWMGGGDPYARMPATAGGVAPFALATAHQAPAATVAAVEQAGQQSHYTTSIYDYITLPFFDQRHPPKVHADPHAQTENYAFIPPVTYPWSEGHIPKFFEHTTSPVTDRPPKVPPDEK
jgi:hypothetical protein